MRQRSGGGGGGRRSWGGGSSSSSLRRGGCSASRLWAHSTHLFCFLLIVTCVAVYNSPVRANAESLHLLQPMLYAAGAATALGLYFLAATADPGIVRDEDDGDCSAESPQVHRRSERRVADVRIPLLDAHGRGASDGDEDDNDEADDRDSTSLTLVSSSDTENVAESSAFSPDATFTPASAVPSSPSVPEPARPFCAVCRVLQPLRTKHCLTCRTCVRRWDHCCPYLGQCVGEFNHKYYILFLLAHVVMLLWTLLLLRNAYFDEDDQAAWLLINAPIGVALLICAVGGTAASGLFVMHLLLACTGQTTWEFFARHRITYMSELRADANPFDVGVLGNLKYMFLSRRPVEWEQLYRLYLAKDDAASGDGLRPRGQDFPMLA